LIAVIIPCYKVRKHILGVLNNIGHEISKIYIVDDNCPEKTGEWVKTHSDDPRVQVLYNATNLGVGGAVKVGNNQAFKDGAKILVKVDGDGQMDPKLILDLISPIVKGKADYVKGNRFFDLENLKDMPAIRLFGNAILSFFNKFSSGYWDIFDPTNGFTAIHSQVWNLIPQEKVSNRYFFETDMLFRLNISRCVVVDFPMIAIYGKEKSNLVVKNVFLSFLKGHFLNFIKRIFYNYFLRNFSLASIELVLGSISLMLGFIFGIIFWYLSYVNNIEATNGQVMLPALLTIVGIQLLLAFLSFDMNYIPKNPRHKSNPKIIN
jgi:dolichol-phosphate mannosyltransferase